MSYLQLPRLAFSGQFQADVSTVNNDPRHFDNRNFEPSFQDLQAKDEFNGWWNPVGTGIFRLCNCTVRSLVGPDGRVLSADGDKRTDAALGLVVGNAPDRASGKLVDLDPDWQLASCLYGFGVSLVSAGGQVILSADYASNPFRDLWFGRSVAKGDSAASAMFQSVLTNVAWNLDGIDSPFFDQLRRASEQDQLSIRLTTYGYNTAFGQPRFGYGTVLGAIGPARAAEPRSFVLGRRFMPTTQNGTGDMASTRNIGCFSAAVDEGTGTLQVDLSNALPLGQGYGIGNLGPLQFALLKDPLVAQDARVGPADFHALAHVDQSDYLQWGLAGIQQLQLPEDVRRTMDDLPFAILGQQDRDGGWVVEVRETLLGLEVRPEDFAIRLDPNEDRTNHVGTTFYAARYGRPLAGAPLAFWTSGPALDTGNTPVNPKPGTTPKALLPVNNVPAFALKFHPPAPVTDRHGRADVCIQGPERMGTPREYMDGQLYTVAYNFAGTDPAVQQNFDKLAILVFSTVERKVAPVWDDVQPILQQYANLYPAMSQGLFDFSRREQAEANAFILRFVLDKPIDDPDQMPVTRDLSSARRALLIRYLDGVLSANGRPPSALAMFGRRCPTRGGAALRAQEGADNGALPALPGKSRGSNR